MGIWVYDRLDYMNLSMRFNHGIVWRWSPCARWTNARGEVVLLGECSCCCLSSYLYSCMMYNPDIWHILDINVSRLLLSYIEDGECTGRNVHK